MAMKEDEEDDDLWETRLPAVEGYDRLERLKQANLELERDSAHQSELRRSQRVRFSEAIIYTHSEQSPDAGEEEKTSPAKKLLVTLPCNYFRVSEDFPSDTSEAEEPPEESTQIGLGNETLKPLEEEEETVAEMVEDESECGSLNAEAEDVVEEEEEDSTSGLEDTMNSSTETVLYRSGIEESELAEWFSKSIQIDPEEESLELGGRWEEVDERPCRLGVQSVGIRRKESSASDPGAGPVRMTAPRDRQRPATAPASRRQPRHCCLLSTTSLKLPSYNGLRSEYGLSEHQLQERERRKQELANSLKNERERRLMEQRRKAKENEATFNNWLIKKKRETEEKSARRLKQGCFVHRAVPAPTAHLDKIWIMRRKLLKRENSAAYFLLHELLKNAKPHEQKTYRIYLGLKEE